MQLAVSLILNDDDGAARLLDSVRAAGFSGVEPTFVLDGTLPTAADPRGSAERLRRLAHAIGLRVPSMRGGPGFWTTFASSERAARDRAVNLATKAFEALKILGGDTLLIVPGQWDASQTYDATWTFALETAKRVGDAAAEAGITVGLENVENQFLLSPRDWVEFLNAAANPRVRMYFDVGNVVYLRAGHPEQWIRQLGRQFIARVHFKDAKPGEVRNLREGKVNWPAVTSALQAIAYDDWIGIELPLPERGVGEFLKSTYQAAQSILSGREAA